MGGGGGGWEERTSGLFVKSFLPAFREKQHRNIFSHHTGRLAKFGWILTYWKISVEMVVTRLLPRAVNYNNHNHNHIIKIIMKIIMNRVPTSH